MYHLIQCIISLQSDMEDNTIRVIKPNHCKFGLHKSINYKNIFSIFTTIPWQMIKQLIKV